MMPTLKRKGLTIYSDHAYTTLAQPPHTVLSAIGSIVGHTDQNTCGLVYTDNNQIPIRGC